MAIHSFPYWRNESPTRGLLAAWLTVGAGIPLLSFVGRDLQRALQQSLPHAVITWLISLTLLGLVAAAVSWLVQRQGPRNLWHLLWLLPLVLTIHLAFPVAEERMHFILFGLFGFLNLRLLVPVAGLTLCMAGAGLDELLQLGLPERVADLRDVASNAVAGLGGAVLAIVGERE